MKAYKFISLIAFLLTFSVMAQDKVETPPFRTDNTTLKQDDNKKKNEPDRKKISFIIKNDPSGILYGNPCLNEETRKMGFQYSVQNQGLPGTLKPVTLFLHNLKVYSKLILTRSPFWKVILNNRIKDCRERTGDWIG